MKPDGLSTYSQEPTTSISPVPNEQSTYASLVSVRSILICFHLHLGLPVGLFPLVFLRFDFFETSYCHKGPTLQYSGLVLEHHDSVALGEGNWVLELRVRGPDLVAFHHLAYG